VDLTKKENPFRFSFNVFERDFAYRFKTRTAFCPSDVRSLTRYVPVFMFAGTLIVDVDVSRFARYIVFPAASTNIIFTGMANSLLSSTVNESSITVG
jgi:hypothetical protein